MKQYLTIILLFVLIGCQNEYRYECKCTGETVCVTILNQTDKKIKFLKLRYENGETVTGLDPQGKTCLSFESGGENSFKLTAVFNTGDTIHSIATYSEGGYKYTAKISKDTIKLDLATSTY